MRTLRCPGQFEDQKKILQTYRKQRRINIEALKTSTTAQRFEEYITLKLNSIPETAVGMHALNK